MSASVIRVEIGETISPRPSCSAMSAIETTELRICRPRKKAAPMAIITSTRPPRMSSRQVDTSDAWAELTGPAITTLHDQPGMRAYPAIMPFSVKAEETLPL